MCYSLHVLRKEKRLFLLVSYRVGTSTPPPPTFNERWSSNSDECRAKKYFQYVENMFPLFVTILKFAVQNICLTILKFLKIEEKMNGTLSSSALGRNWRSKAHILDKCYKIVKSFIICTKDWQIWNQEMPFKPNWRINLFYSKTVTKLSKFLNASGKHDIGRFVKGVAPRPLSSLPPHFIYPGHAADLRLWWMHL